MSIRRCPYCKAIIDESQKYCNNCGTQLLFPQDESVVEDTKGEKIRDEDFRDAEEDEEGGKPIDLSDDDSIQEEIDLGEIIEGDGVFPDEMVTADTVIDELPPPPPPRERMTPGPQPTPKAIPVPESRAKTPGPAPGPASEKESEPSPEPENDLAVDEVFDEAGREDFELESDDTARSFDFAAEEESEVAEPVGRAEPGFEDRGDIDETWGAEEKRSREAEPEEEPPEEEEAKQDVPDEEEIGGIETGIVAEVDEPLKHEAAEAAGAAEEAEGGYPADAEEETKDDAETREEIGRLISALEKKHKKAALSGDEDEIVAPLEEEADDISAWTESAPPKAAAGRKQPGPAERGAGRSLVPGDTRDFEEDVMRETGMKTASRSTIGIPETVTTLIEEPGERESNEPIPDFVFRRRLGLPGFLVASLFDLLFVVVLWLGTSWLAARILDLPLVTLLRRAGLQLGLLFIILLVGYLFLFLYFLGETLGARLSARRN
jgi:hypothetical protein